MMGETTEERYELAANAIDYSEQLRGKRSSPLSQQEAHDATMELLRHWDFVDGIGRPLKGGMMGEHSALHDAALDALQSGMRSWFQVNDRLDLVNLRLARIEALLEKGKDDE